MNFPNKQSLRGFPTKMLINRYGFNNENPWFSVGCCRGETKLKSLLVKTTTPLFYRDDNFVWQRGAAGEPVAPQGCPETPPADISSPRTSFGDPVQEEIAPLDWWPERHRLQRPLRRANTWNLLSSTGRSPPLVPWLYPSVMIFHVIEPN